MSYGDPNEPLTNPIAYTGGEVAKDSVKGLGLGALAGLVFRRNLEAMGAGSAIGGLVGAASGFNRANMHRDALLMQLGYKSAADDIEEALEASYARQRNEMRQFNTPLVERLPDGALRLAPPRKLGLGAADPRDMRQKGRLSAGMPLFEPLPASHGPAAGLFRPAGNLLEHLPPKFGAGVPEKVAATRLAQILRTADTPAQLLRAHRIGQAIAPYRAEGVEGLSRSLRRVDPHAVANRLQIRGDELRTGQPVPHEPVLDLLAARKATEMHALTTANGFGVVHGLTARNDPQRQAQIFEKVFEFASGPQGSKLMQMGQDTLVHQMGARANEHLFGAEAARDIAKYMPTTQAARRAEKAQQAAVRTQQSRDLLTRAWQKTPQVVPAAEAGDGTFRRPILSDAFAHIDALHGDAGGRWSARLPIALDRTNRDTFAAAMASAQASAAQSPQVMNRLAWSGRRVKRAAGFLPPGTLRPVGPDDPLWPIAQEIIGKDHLGRGLEAVAAALAKLKGRPVPADSPARVVKQAELGRLYWEGFAFAREQVKEAGFLDSALRGVGHAVGYARKADEFRALDRVYPAARQRAVSQVMAAKAQINPKAERITRLFNSGRMPHPSLPGAPLGWDEGMAIMADGRASLRARGDLAALLPQHYARPTRADWGMGGPLGRPTPKPIALGPVGSQR